MCRACRHGVESPNRRPRGKGGGDRDALAGKRVDERRRQGVQAVSRHVLHGEGAVEAVVDDMQARHCELGADLMRDAGEDGHFEERALFGFDLRVGYGTVGGDGVQGARGGAFGFREPVVDGIDHLAIGEGRVVDKIVFQRCAVEDVALNQGEILLLDRLRGELGAEAVERFLRSGDEDESGRAGIDAMERACHEGPVAKRDAFRMERGDAVHESAGFSVRIGVDGDAGGFVEREEGGVFVDRAHGDGRVGLDEVVAFFGEALYLDLVALAQL